VENIQLDMAVISTESTSANMLGQGNNGTLDASKSPFFSKVLANEQTPEKAPNEITSKKGDSEHTAVADGNALPEEDTDLPQEAEQSQETEKKAEIIPLQAEGELNIPELLDEQATLEVPEQTLLPDTIETTESSPIVIEEDVVETVENLVQPEDNIIPIALPTETKETEPSLKVANTPEVVATNLETEVDAIPQSEVPESDAPAETVVALNPQQAINVKPTTDPESKTSKVAQKTGVIDKLSLVDTKADATRVADTESLPEKKKKKKRKGGGGGGGSTLSKGASAGRRASASASSSPHPAGRNCRCGARSSCRRVPRPSPSPALVANRVMRSRSTWVRAGPAPAHWAEWASPMRVCPGPAAAARYRGAHVWPGRHELHARGTRRIPRGGRDRRDPRRSRPQRSAHSAPASRLGEIR